SRLRTKTLLILLKIIGCSAHSGFCSSATLASEARLEKTEVDFLGMRSRISFSESHASDGGVSVVAAVFCHFSKSATALPDLLPLPLGDISALLLKYETYYSR